ncbi:unnamed protein product, partial [Amoebophrya sp. A120]|eukprot:GSA120T00000817001.1
MGAAGAVVGVAAGTARLSMTLGATISQFENSAAKELTLQSILQKETSRTNLVQVSGSTIGSASRTAGTSSGAQLISSAGGATAGPTSKKLQSRDLDAFFTSAEGKFLQKEWDRGFSTSEQVGIMENEHEVTNRILVQLDRMRQARSQFRLQKNRQFIEKKVRQRLAAERGASSLRTTSMSQFSTQPQQLRERREKEVRREIERDLLHVYKREDSQHDFLQGIALQKLRQKSLAHRENLHKVRREFVDGLKKAFLRDGASSLSGGLVRQAEQTAAIV